MVDEYELADFFQALPALLDEDVPWAYNEATYTAADESARIHFAINPSCRDVRIRVTIGDSEVFDLHAVSVEDVLHHRDPAAESLEVIVTEKHSLWLTLRPRIAIRQESTR